jgi:ketosteroid isomerase-like protein
MRTSFRLIACVAIAMASGSPSLFAQTGTARAAIDAGNAKFSAAFAAGSAADLAAMYTADAMAFPPDSDVVRGQAAIQRLWQGLIDSGMKGIALTTTDLEVSGDTAVETGTAVLTDGSGAQMRAKYLVVWKQDGGQWKLHRDIWNSVAPGK